MSAFAGILKLGFEKKDYYKFNGKLPQKEDINRGLKIFTKIAIIWISLIIIIQLIIILKNM
jgi:adenosylcobinamide-phosphate synthase